MICSLYNLPHIKPECQNDSRRAGGGMKKFTHIKSRVDVAPEVELFFKSCSRGVFIFCMVVNGTNVVPPSLMESHMSKWLLLVLLLLFF